MGYDSPNRDPEIRRRAAWLLAMLALVAGLFVLVFVVFLNGGDKTNDIADPTTLPTPSSTAPSTSGTSRSSDSATGSASDSASGSPTTTGSTGSSTGSPAPGGPVSCPTKALCALNSDVGNAVEAVNAYRVDKGKDPVPGKVSDKATKCALSNGSDCSGGWVQTTLPLDNDRADGVAAVDKVKTRGKLLSSMKSFAVGWAYDPDSKTLYFAVIRQDG